jgi:serine/threonine protein phosphatase 1
MGQMRFCPIALALGGESWFNGDQLRIPGRMEGGAAGSTARKTASAFERTSMSTYVIGDIHGRFLQLKQLERDVPWDMDRDTIVFLGDLIDRGSQIPEVVDEVIRLKSRNPNLVTVRGNHEQMLLDCVETGDLAWLLPENGGQATISQYGCPLHKLRETQDIRVPPGHLELFRSMPLFYEDEHAIYVHAGLTPGLAPDETDEDVLLWSRDFAFYTGYAGKLCFFGHTPTRYLPRQGRRHEHDIFMMSDCVGMDTGCEVDCPLSCLRVDDFTLYQAFATGNTEVYAHQGLLDAYRERQQTAIS